MIFGRWKPARGDKSSDAFNVSVLAASRLWISQVWRDCRQAGMDCWAIDGLPLAMARAVGLVGGLGGGRRALAVDWGYSNTTLCIVGDDRPLYSRRIQDCAFGRVLESIMQAFDVTLDEAQHLAESEGLALPQEQTADGAGRRASDYRSGGELAGRARPANQPHVAIHGNAAAALATERRFG